MSDDAKWPITFERVRGHWIGMFLACLAAARFAFWRVAEGGTAALIEVRTIVFAVLVGGAAYWGWRAIDYTGWRVMSNYLPRR
jgi:hypothetical protein